MAAATLKHFMDRSARYLKTATEKTVKMDAFIMDTRQPRTLLSFDSARPPVDPIYEFKLGTDADIGGFSTCSLTEIPSDPSSSSSTPSSSSASSSANAPPRHGEPTGLASQSHVAFHGNLSLKVPPEKRGKMRSGFAMFRSQNRTTIFGENYFDLEGFTHVKLVLAYRGSEAWRGRWYCNLQMARDISTDLFQHRLDLPASEEAISTDPLTAPIPTFHTIHLPLRSFTCVSNTSPLDRLDRIRSIGFSLLGTRHGDIYGGAPPPLSAVLQEFSNRGTKAPSKEHSSAEVDEELEDMIREDARAAQALSGGQSAEKVGEVGWGSLGGAEEVQTEMEGYFELSVKSVEAVKWDPEKEAEEMLGKQS